jgi:hypothetical protein
VIVGFRGYKLPGCCNMGGKVVTLGPWNTVVEFVAVCQHCKEFNSLTAGAQA